VEPTEEKKEGGKAMNGYWHVYSRGQIKPDLVGDCVYGLAIPENGKDCIKSYRGKALPHDRIGGLNEIDPGSIPLSRPFGLIFNGINQESIRKLDQSEDEVVGSGFEVPCHNQRLISNARNLLLANPGLPGGVDPLAFCLLRGLTHLLPSFESLGRPPVSAPSHEITGRGILVVEDDTSLLDIFRFLLESMGYRNVHLARDGIEALTILETLAGQLDLIVLNWQMPQMDGVSLMRYLNQNWSHTVGVIMESGYPYDDYRKEFFKWGTDSVVPIDYLVKPFAIEEFKLEINVAMEFIRRKKSRPA
jgi:CheY-like chemotaxis protein